MIILCYRRVKSSVYIIGEAVGPGVYLYARPDGSGILNHVYNTDLKLLCQAGSENV